MLEVAIEDRIGDLELAADFKVAGGEIVAVTGQSGCGKTTLLRAIAGLRRPSSGTISCGGEEWFDAGSGIDVPAGSRRTGFVFQEYALFPRMSALGNVGFALAELPRPQRTAQAEALLERVGLAGLATRSPAGMSGGERQRLALARALARRPSVLLLDEPFAALDPATAGSALELVRSTVTELGLPCLLVTHDGSATAAADRQLALERGRPARIL